MSFCQSKFRLFLFLSFIFLSYDASPISEKDGVCQAPMTKDRERKNIKSLKGQIDFWDREVRPAIEAAWDNYCFSTYGDDAYKSFDDGAVYKNMYINFVTDCIRSHNAQKRLGADHSKFVKKLIDRNNGLYDAFLEEFKQLSLVKNKSAERFQRFLRLVNEFEKAPKILTEKKKKEPVKAEAEKSVAIDAPLANTSTASEIKRLQRDVDLLLEGL